MEQALWQTRVYHTRIFCSAEESLPKINSIPESHESNITTSLLLMILLTLCINSPAAHSCLHTFPSFAAQYHRHCSVEELLSPCRSLCVTAFAKWQNVNADMLHLRAVHHVLAHARSAALRSSLWSCFSSALPPPWTWTLCVLPASFVRWLLNVEFFQVCKYTLIPAFLEVVFTWSFWWDYWLTHSLTKEDNAITPLYIIPLPSTTPGSVCLCFTAPTVQHGCIVGWVILQHLHL